MTAKIEVTLIRPSDIT